jgi:hypothetical protein
VQQSSDLEGLLIRCRAYPAPIYAPMLSRHSQPNQRFHWGSSRVVVKSSGALIKAAGVRRLAKPESLTVEVMAELVTECACSATSRSRPAIALSRSSSNGGPQNCLVSSSGSYHGDRQRGIRQ